MMIWIELSHYNIYDISYILSDQIYIYTDNSDNRAASGYIHR